MFHNIYLTNTELDAQVKTIVDFLGAVHPELKEKSTQGTCVELRPINRSPDEFSIILARSLNLWRLDEKSIDVLRDFLHKHNGQPYCLYYSVFSFDYNKEAYTKSGSKAKKGKITSSTAAFTNEIVLDFDGIDYLGFSKLVADIENLGIEGLWVFTGHGYQLHILLDEPLYDEKSLFRLVYLFRAKGYLCDPSCVDSARLMRLPFTYNCKCFSQEGYDEEYNNPPLCKIIKESSKRYSLEKIVELVSAIPTVNLHDEKVYFDSLKNTPSENEEEKDEDFTSGDIAIDRVEYPDYLFMDSLPEPIVKMLRYTPRGYRNITLGFLIGFFKNYLLLGKNQIFEVLDIWNTQACEPSLPQDIFVKDFDRLYRGNGLPYSSQLSNMYGLIDFDNQAQLHRDNKVFIPNTVFQSLNVIDGNVLRAYLAVKILEHGNSVDDADEIPITIDAIAEVTSVSIPTLRRVLPVAKKMNLLYVTQGAKKLGVPNTYHCNQINSHEAGFKALSVNDLDVYLSSSSRLKLTDNELKLYLFMLYKFYTKDRSMALDKIGGFVGLAKSSVSRNITSLQAKRYLKIERIYMDRVRYFNKYTLLK